MRMPVSQDHLGEAVIPGGSKIVVQEGPGGVCWTEGEGAVGALVGRVEPQALLQALDPLRQGVAPGCCSLHQGIGQAVVGCDPMPCTATYSALSALQLDSLCKLPACQLKGAQIPSPKITVLGLC